MGRDAIMAYIEEHGASNKSNLQRETGLAYGTLSYNLGKLSVEGELILQYWGNELWIFHPLILEQERYRFVAVKRSFRMKLLDFLSNRNPMTAKEISEELQSTQKTIRKHLGHLLYAGEVERSPTPPHRYQVASRPHPSPHELPDE